MIQFLNRAPAGFRNLEVIMFNEQELRTAVSEILSVEPELLSADTELASFASYDSTAHLSLMVCLSDFSPKEFGLADIKAIRTYGDLVRLLES